MSENDSAGPVEGTDGADDTQPVIDLLAEHVPLALIVDLVAPEVTSAEILESEGLPDDEWWEDDPKSSGADA